MDCDVHANCHNGRCRCRRGYKGTGLKGDCKQGQQHLLAWMLINSYSESEAW